MSVYNSSEKQSDWAIFNKKIDSIDYAIDFINATSIIFYLIAGLQILLSILPFWFDPVGIIAAVILVILSFLLYQFKSRIIAILLFIYCSYILLSTGYYFLMGGYGGRNIVTALILIAFAYKALQATIYLHKNKAV